MSKSKVLSHRRLVNVRGRRFGHLVTVRELSPKSFPSGQTQRRWECLCDCGNTVAVLQCSLISGVSTSCGCWRRQKSCMVHRGHGMSHTTLPDRWEHIRQCCNNKNDNSYKNYGGRGIKVCKRWDVFDNFLADMGPTYKPGLQIERINNDGDYCPENCRWATQHEQAVNKRSNRLWTYRGATHPVSVWARHFGICYSTVMSRLNTGWPIERAITEPVHKSKQNATS